MVINEGETAPVGAAIGILAETEDEIADAKAKAAASSGGSAVPAPKVENSSPFTQKVDVPPLLLQLHLLRVPGKVVATPNAKKLAK